jgi:aspartyl/asparaginyl beta-hydroxylase (cupin superfamily)
MNLANLNFIHHSDFDVSNIVSLIQTKNIDWDEYKFRQTRFGDHSETKTIPLIWSEKFDGFQKWHHYDDFSSEIKKIDSIIRNFADPEGEIITAILINLPSGCSIGRHKDANPIGDKFNLCNRIHIPILTNPDCVFEIDGEEINMKAGEIWEISNVKKMHSVRNLGDNDRVHLLIDWVPLAVRNRFFD